MVSLHYCHWQKWNHLSYKRYWSGKLIYLNFSKWSLHIVLRKDWIVDMMMGKK